MGAQSVRIDATDAGKQFDGIGAVSGGGATSDLLKDYPQPQRGQILDLLFKPKFGASISTFYVEIGGDGNSTQGSELSHMHWRNDENYHRGYEWWLMREAKQRNPAITLDACAWGCPGWVGNGNFYSQDMCDYYTRWIKGLKATYGLDLDAIGCRNERGVHEDFVKRFRRTLDAAGLQRVIIHGFDNWDKTKWDWCKDLVSDPELARAVGAVSNHTIGLIGEDNGPMPDATKAILAQLGKPVWDSEEHVYREGFDCEISLVSSFNSNYLNAGATKTVNWYLVDSTYPVEPFKIKPGMLIADSPWSGHYSIREALWGYAHYGQFTQAGWYYVNNACGRLEDGGTYVTLLAPSCGDYSVIAETRGAKQPQTISFALSKGVSAGKLCVWRSNSHEQFIRQADVEPVNGSYTVTFDPESIYSLSTTTGQQKGSFGSIPAAAPFPFPYRETFDTYTDPVGWGYLPHYTADITGAFEIANRPDGHGRCLRQVLDKKATSWGTEASPFTILGDAAWKDYDFSCDVLLDHGGWAGLLARVTSVNDAKPQGYFLHWSADGDCALFTTAGGDKAHPLGKQLATAHVAGIGGNQWHNLKLQCIGQMLTAFVDGVQVLQVNDAKWTHGMVGLYTGGDSKTTDTADFGNLTIKSPSAPVPSAVDFGTKRLPMY